MLSKLILLTLFVNLLTALPAPKLGNQSSEAWTAEKACADVSRTSLLRNENDPTCSTYVYCYLANGSVYALTKRCKQGSYFDDSSKLCTTIKPDVCT